MTNETQRNTMAENEKAEELINYLASLGFEGEKLRREIVQGYEDFQAGFTVHHRIPFGEELMRYELQFVYDRQFMAYRLRSFKATHRLPISIEHKIINGIDTGQLEEKMKDVDWDDQIDKAIVGSETEEYRHVVSDLIQLTAEPNFDGEHIQSQLIFKYYSESNWDDAAKDLQENYERSKTYSAGEFGICNAALAYHDVSGQLDSIYESVRQSGIEEYPGVDLYSLVSTYLSKPVEEFEIEFSQVEQEGIIDFGIPVHKSDGEWYAETIQVSFTQYPEIYHGIYNGVDSSALEEQMKNVDWEKDKLYIFLENDEVALLPFAKDIKDKVFLLKEVEEAKTISDYLQLRYWSGSFMEMFTQEDTLKAFGDWTKVRCDFPIDIKCRSIYNLMAGRAIKVTNLSGRSLGDNTWLKINPDILDDNNDATLEKIKGLSENQLQDLLDMVPLQSDNDQPIRSSLMEGNPVDVRLKNGKQILVSVDSTAENLLLSTKEGKPIPVNFHFDPDWKPMEIKQQDSITIKGNQSKAKQQSSRHTKRKGKSL